MDASGTQTASFGGALELISRQWKVLAASIATCVLFATVYLMLATPIYRAEVVLAPVRQQDQSALLSQLGGLASLAGININSTANSRNALAILSSRAFILNFIGRHGLHTAIAPEYAANEAGKPESVPDPNWLQEAVSVFQDDVMVVQTDAKTGLTHIYVDWMDPNLASQWANDLARDVNTYIRTRDQTQAERNLAYLTEQFGKTSLLGIQDAISRLIESEMSTAMLASAREEYAFEVIDPAMRPLIRHSPRTVLVIALALILGGLIGLGTASIVDVRKNPTVRVKIRADHEPAA